MSKNKKIKDILLIILSIGVVCLSIGFIVVLNDKKNVDNKKNDNDEKTFDLKEKKLKNKIIFKKIKDSLLDKVIDGKLFQSKLNDVLNITKKEEFDKKEENKFKILKDEILKVLGEYIDVILKSEENKENKDEYFQIINEFKNLITVEFLKEKIGHIKFEDENLKLTGVFKEIKEEKKEICNLFVQYFENLKNEEKKYFFSSKEKDKENEFANSEISKKFKDIFSWFKEEKSYDNKFSRMENIEQIKIIKDENVSQTEKEVTDSNDETKKGDSEVKTKIEIINESKKTTLIKENKEKKQYTVNGILLTGENIELSETDEQFLERKVKYEFIKYFESNIKNMEKFNLINNFLVQNEKFNDELIKEMFKIDEENKTEKDGSSFKFNFDEKETFEKKTIVKVLNDFCEGEYKVEKIKRIIEILREEVNKKIDFKTFLSVNIRQTSSKDIEIQRIIDLLKQIQELNKSEIEKLVVFKGEKGDKGSQGPRGLRSETGIDKTILKEIDTRIFVVQEDANKSKSLLENRDPNSIYGRINRLFKIVGVNTTSGLRVRTDIIQTAVFTAKKKSESNENILSGKTTGKGSLEERINFVEKKIKVNLQKSLLKLRLNMKVMDESIINKIQTKTDVENVKNILNNKEKQKWIYIFKEPQIKNSFTGLFSDPVFFIYKLDSEGLSIREYVVETDASYIGQVETYKKHIINFKLKQRNYLRELFGYLVNLNYPNQEDLVKNKLELVDLYDLKK